MQAALKEVSSIFGNSGLEFTLPTDGLRVKGLRVDVLRVSVFRV